MRSGAARRSASELAGVALLAVTAAVMARRMGDFAIDDFFITYRYAENLASGLGLVFNPGERVFGTTAPGLALVLAALRRSTGLPMPFLGTMVTFVGLVTTTAIVFVQGRRRGRGAEALAGGLLVVALPYAWLHTGAEIFLVLPLLAVAASLARARPSIGGIVAGSAAWCRPDAVLGVGILGLLEWARCRRLPWAYGLAAGGVLAAGLAAAHVWFGRFLPVTLEAKRIQAAWRPGTYPSGLEFWPTAVRYLAEYAAGIALVPLAVVGLAGLAVAARRGGPAIRLLVLYAVLQAVSYPLLRVPPYSWYLVPAVVVLLYGVAFAAGAAGRAAWRFFGARPPAAVPALAVAALLFAPVGWEIGRRAWWMVKLPSMPDRLDDYRRTGLWLRTKTAPDQVVATIEVGALGYYSERPTHDILGLVSPASLPHLARGDLAGALASGDPDVFLVYAPHAPLLEAITSTEAFAERWCEIARIPGSEELAVYGRRAGGAGGPAGRPACAPSTEEALRRGAVPLGGDGS